MELLCIFLEDGSWVEQLLYEIYRKSILVIKVFNLCFSDKMQFLQATNIGFCLVLSCKFVFVELKNRCQKMGFPVTISRRKSIEKKIFRQKTLLWDWFQAASSEPGFRETPFLFWTTINVASRAYAIFQYSWRWEMLVRISRKKATHSDLT